MIEVNNSNHPGQNRVEVSTNYITTEHERNNGKNEEINSFKTLNHSGTTSKTLFWKMTISLP